MTANFNCFEQGCQMRDRQQLSSAYKCLQVLSSSQPKSTDLNGFECMVDPKILYGEQISGLLESVPEFRHHAPLTPLSDPKCEP